MDLFRPPLVPGFGYQDEFLDAFEERSLIARLEEADLAPFRFQQWTAKRFTRSYGWSYDFQDGTFVPTEAIPDWLTAIKERAAQVAGLEAVELAQALVIRYDPGAGIGWHRDRSVFEHVIGISMGHAATLRFRRRAGRRFQRASQLLLPRSIYHLSGDARYEWEHSIGAMDRPRWSITFRSLA